MGKHNPRAASKFHPPPSPGPARDEHPCHRGKCALSRFCPVSVHPWRAAAVRTPLPTPRGERRCLIKGTGFRARRRRSILRVTGAMGGDCPVEGHGRQPKSQKRARLGEGLAPARLSKKATARAPASTDPARHGVRWWGWVPGGAPVAERGRRGRQGSAGPRPKVLAAHLAPIRRVNELCPGWRLLIAALPD